MPEEPLDPILIQVTVPLPIPMIFAAFTQPGQLSGWLCDAATVEPRVGGAYHLRWTAGEPFDSAGTITELHDGVDIGFTWQGPKAFSELLNTPEPATRAYVRLQESPEGIDVTLEHTGWGAGVAWEEARSWHFHFWDERLHRLKEFLLKAAYG